MKSDREFNVGASDTMLEQIFGYMNSLVMARDFESTLKILTDLGRCVTWADRATFWYLDKEKNQYWTLAATGTNDRIVVDQGKGIVGACIENNETIIINDPYNDNRFNKEVDKKTGYVTKSILCMPVKDSRGNVIGAYQVINKMAADGKFDDTDISRLSLAAVYCGSMLETHILSMESRTDALTGLLNRRGFYEDLDRFFKGEDSKNRNSIIMCDIDFFKKVNDTYGHNAGDAVLAGIAKVLTSKVNPDDLICRWGGEEFIILLHDCDITMAIDVAERIRKFVEQSCVNYGDENINVTMSFGVSEFLVEHNVDENIKIADERLYTAKQNGRNQVVFN